MEKRNQLIVRDARRAHPCCVVEKQETMIHLTINDTPVTVPKGTTILHAARQVGVRIPTLCYVERLQAIGACRVCVVEIEGMINLAASCSMPVAEGMRVRTNTRRVRQARRLVVELLLSEHDGDCQTCDRREDCELQATLRGTRHSDDQLCRAEDPQTHRSLDARPDARPRQMHQVPSLRERLCRDAACRRLVGARAGIRHGHWPGLQSRLDHGGLCAVRPVRRSLSGRRHHRTIPYRPRVGRD